MDFVGIYLFLFFIFAKHTNILGETFLKKYIFLTSNSRKEYDFIFGVSIPKGIST